MAQTRFHDDPYRIKKQNEQQAYSCMYHLNTPGQGIDMPFNADPHIRLQYWGANLKTNTTQLESELRGQTRYLNRDLISINNYESNMTISNTNNYGYQNPYIEESRTICPAWTIRELEQNKTQWLTPSNVDTQPINIDTPFSSNVCSRILAKDSFVNKY